ncbi:MAG: hypothetical protein KJP21_06955, partial [Bacteroidia bacterium]|nr:hypothetical protein [Bacteroidia bacterium]
VKSNPEIKVFSTSLEQVSAFKEILSRTTFCLSGKQLRDINKLENDIVSKIERIVLAPSPRNIEVTIPSYDENKIYELSELHYADQSEDSPFIIALELAFIENGDVELLGFDGYPNSTDKGVFLNQLNNQIIQSYRNLGLHITSLTKTKYLLEKGPSIHAKTMFI